jgi:hypothetical protein
MIPNHNASISHPSLRPPGKTGFPVVKNHTFAQWNSPDKETTPVIAKVVECHPMSDGENITDVILRLRFQVVWTRRIFSI